PVFDKNGSRLLVIAGITNKTITAIDVVSGDRSILSSTNVGAGAELNSPLNMVLDEAGNRLLVTQNAGPVLAIDLDTGDRSIVSGAGVGSGDAITSTLGIALDADNGRAF